MMNDPILLDGAVENWHSRTIFKRLLGYLLNNTEINCMSLGERHARAYQYSMQDQFENVEDKRRQHLQMVAIQRGNDQHPLIPVSPSMSLLVECFKNRLVCGAVYSISRELFAIAKEPEAVPGIFDSNDLVVSMLPGGLAVPAVMDSVFFEIVVQRPEAKLYMRVGHAARI